MPVFGKSNLIFTLIRADGMLKVPLDAGGLGTIAVIGPLADSQRDTLGPWCFDFDLAETVTLLQGMRDKGQVQPGQTVLVNGAGGGAGSFAVQLARLYGAEVTGVDHTRKLDFVRSLGAHHVGIAHRQHGDGAGDMETADRDHDAARPQRARDVERARKLVRLHADQEHHAGAGRADEHCEAGLRDDDRRHRRDDAPSRPTSGCRAAPNLVAAGLGRTDLVRRLVVDGRALPGQPVGQAES